MVSRLVGELLSQAGVAVDGGRPWDIRVGDDRFFRRVLREKNLGLGESYMDGWWSCPRVDEFICRVLSAGLDETVRGSPHYLLCMLPAVVFNLQSRRRASVIAERHYDLDNDLFLSFLDPYNQYSCGFFDGTDDLAAAQENKLAMICRKTAVGARDHVLDIGCGWGGFARYAAETVGCRVTAVNVSKEQIHFARRFCKGLPVQIEERDYRSVQGTFDKIVSVGMFEHVGHRNYRTFMEVVHRCLAQDGIFLLHTIGDNVSKPTINPWITKYIFPGSELPSVAQISRAAEGLFVMEDWHNLGPHYDKTLMAWHANFQRAWPALSKRFDERFKRMWDYYLLSCAGAFRARAIQVWQIVFTRGGRSQPACRH